MVYTNYLKIYQTNYYLEFWEIREFQENLKTVRNYSLESSFFYKMKIL